MTKLVTTAGLPVSNHLYPRPQRQIKHTVRMKNDPEALHFDEENSILCVKHCGECITA